MIEPDIPPPRKRLTSKQKALQAQGHYERHLALNMAQARADYLELNVDHLPEINADSGAEIQALFEEEKKFLTEIEGSAEKELLGKLHHLVEVTKSLIDSKGPLFYVKRFSRYRFDIKSTPKGRAFLSKLKIAPSIRDQFLHQRLTPYFDLFWQCAGKHHVELISDMRFVTEAEALDQVFRLNSAVDQIRNEGGTKKFATTCNNFHRSSDKNYNELLKYVRRHSEHTGRLLICRCDIGVKKKSSAFHHANSWHQAQVLHKGRELLFDFINNKFGENFLGFAWKLEFGIRRGFHYHLMFIFNGRNLKSDIPIVRIIGEHWRNVIMGGQGTYYNCNAYKESYKSCGIGPYSKNVNPQKWEGIELMCAYLTKPDDLVRLQIDGMRAFGKGNMPDE